MTPTETPETSLPFKNPALFVYVPVIERMDPMDDIAEAYAVEVSDDIPGGCILWGRWHGTWQANVSARWLMTRFVRATSLMVRSKISGKGDWSEGWRILRALYSQKGDN